METTKEKKKVCWSKSWKGYCVNCKKVIDEANNGQVIEAVAERHIRETGHEIIVGTSGMILED